MLNPSDFIAKKFGRLTITEVGPAKQGGRYCFAICDCGISKDYNLNHLKRGDILSCGCLQREQVKKSNTTHGLKKHPLYGLWENIKTRCYNPNFKFFNYYGGRGIRVCSAWLNDFQVFYEWAINNGWQKGLEIDRENNNGDYEPSNCRFVTGKVNCRNKRNNVLITYNGESKCLIEWCDTLNLKYNKMHNRITSGWAPEKAFSNLK